MTTQPFSKTVEDSVPKVDNALAVGEDIEFQRTWWKFEQIIWIVFGLILICDLLGVFGRGWLSKATRVSQNHALQLNYERTERADTPSIMTMHFSQQAIRDGQIKVFVSHSVIGSLGAQRISPQPVSSTLGNGGITYAFSATAVPAVVQISLSPSFPGLHKFTVQMVDGQPLNGTVLVFP